MEHILWSIVIVGMLNLIGLAFIRDALRNSDIKEELK